MIKKNKKIYAIAKVIKMSKDAELIDVLCGREGVYSVIYHHNGEKNANKLIYYISREDQHEGFFALLRTTLYHLEFANRFHLTPYVEWSNKCSYFERGGYNGQMNPFEYFFEQPSNITKEDICNSQNIVYSKGDDTKVLSQFPLNSPYYYSSEFISKMANLVKKYIHIQNEIQKRLESDVKTILQENKILSIHYRGTDFKKNYDRHPIVLQPEDYFRNIELEIERCGYKKIFIATDDLWALKKFKDRFGSMVTCYENTLRGEGEISVMYSDNERENNNFLKGYEVLRDVYTMATGDGIISGVSMVSIFARIFREARNEVFETNLFLDNGTNSNSNKWVTMK